MLLTSKVALVVGVGGVTGTPLAEELLRSSGWKVYGISRRAPVLDDAVPGGALHHLAVDLSDAQATRDALSECRDITHVFYCANNGSREMRLTMITNLLDALEVAAAGFENINLLQGTKYYGSHLGPFKTPAREGDPRVAGGDFYYSEEDLITSRQGGKRWTWTAVRPHSVCGYAAGNPMNLASVIGIYGSMQRELGQPFGFPASSRCFDTLFNVVDAELLARAAIWVSTHRACANQAFNVNNGDYFRWRQLWPALAEFFGLRVAGPLPYTLPEFLASHEALWHDMARKYGLKPFPFARAPSWAQGDYAAPHSRFACEYDVISDLVKIRQAGFCEAIESVRMFRRILTRLRSLRVIP